MVRSGGMLLVFLALAVGVCGCGGSSAPKAYPVKGSVVFEKGGDISKLVGATVEFESVATPEIHAYGEIKDGGVFTMTTQTKGVAQEGAIAGEHRIRILFETFEDEDEPKKKPKAIIDPKFRSFDKSGLKVTIPTEQTLVLKVWR